MWSTVSAHAANSPANLKLKDGKEINHSELIEDITEAQDGYYYVNQAFINNGHFQTLLASRPYDDQWQVWYGRRLIRWSDGSQNSVDYAIDPPASKTEWEEDIQYKPVPDLPRFPTRTRYLRPEEIKPIEESDEPLVIHLHGLTGGSHENYVRCAIKELEKMGLKSCVLTTRGCNRTPITTPYLFNACWTEDIRNFVNHLISVFPQRPLFLAGYSLGAAVLANYLGQEGDRLPQQIKAAVSVANPWDLNISSWSLEKSWSGQYLYGKAMASNLLRLLRNNKKTLDESPIFRDQWEKAKHMQFNSVSDFDSMFTAPMFYFDGCRDYYRTASSINRIHTIRVPLLILHALDDPIVSKDVIPFKETESNPYLHLLTTSTGGHLGWFSRDSDRWYSVVLAKYLAGFLDKVDLNVRPKATLRERWFQGDRFVV